MSIKKTRAKIAPVENSKNAGFIEQYWDLRQKLNRANIPEWLESERFKELTTSDASNNRANLIGRVEYVRDMLLT
jgi:hypothetical protein